MPGLSRLAAPLVALVLAGCALGGPAGTPTPPTTRASDFRGAQVRQAAVLVRVVVAADAGLSERERKDLPALYEAALLEALDARAVLVRDVRTLDAGAAVPEAAAAAARAREVGADHALVVSLRVEPDIVRVCEDTRRPVQGRAAVWKQDARVVRAADGGERLRAEVATPAVEAECDGPRPGARRRGVEPTAGAAVEGLVGRMLAR